MSFICESGEQWSRKLTTKTGTVMQCQAEAAAAAAPIMEVMCTGWSGMRSLNDITKTGKSQLYSHKW